MKLKYFPLLILLAFVINACGSQKRKTVKRSIKTTKTVAKAKKTPAKPEQQPHQKPQPPVKKEDALRVQLPEVKREFRAAWVASVANINWPSKKNLSVQEQKNEALFILELLKNHHFNAVIFQVRPSADALYKSNLEPWSYFLTGEVGRAPEPYYDPLEFWIEEAHKLGMELHIWLNPYRAHHSNGGKITPKSMVNTTDANVVRLKNGMYWFDPSDPKTQNHTSAVVRDLVRRYDIDAVHFDDYFYPYSSYNNGADFPDQRTWNEYIAKGGQLSKADWRRENVNKFVERIYKEIKAEKPYVKFGISPFGIWKPGYPASAKGLSQYDELYADAKLWLNKGWVDYFSPQLYWAIDSKGQSFRELLLWWKAENTHKRHLWPGLNTVEIKASHRPTEIANQIRLTREILGDDAGALHWSVAGLIKKYDMLSTLAKDSYKEEALAPKSPWIKSEKAPRPELNYTLNSQSVTINWKTSQPAKAFKWVLYLKYGDSWETMILNPSETSKAVERVKNSKSLSVIALQSVDRLSNESDYTVLKVQ